MSQCAQNYYTVVFKKSNKFIKPSWSLGLDFFTSEFNDIKQIRHIKFLQWHVCSQSSLSSTVKRSYSEASLIPGLAVSRRKKNREKNYLERENGSFLSIAKSDWALWYVAIEYRCRLQGWTIQVLCRCPSNGHVTIRPTSRHTNLHRVVGYIQTNHAVMLTISLDMLNTTKLSASSNSHSNISQPAVWFQSPKIKRFF